MEIDTRITEYNVVNRTYRFGKVVGFDGNKEPMIEWFDFVQMSHDELSQEYKICNNRTMQDEILRYLHA